MSASWQSHPIYRNTGSRSGIVSAGVEMREFHDGCYDISIGPVYHTKHKDSALS